MFRLSHQPLIPIVHACDSAGGFVTFEGKVRNHANLREVLRLEYEAYEDLAVSEGEKLVAEAVARYRLESATVVHRVGLLEVGETAVIIQTAAAHRREAFAGCEWILDQLKHRVPIWKKEYYADGDSGWVGADAPGPNPELDAQLTQRQRRLAEIGDAGQARLKAASVLLVGAGGLAAGCLPYLAAAGVGTLGLIDDDVVDVSNLHRQILFSVEDVGRLKVERAAQFVNLLNPTVEVHRHAERLTEANVDRFVASYDWIVDGSDNLPTKFLLNQACRRHSKPLVTASVHGFEGQLLTVLPDGPCLRCLFPTVPAGRCVGTCAENGILGVVPGTLGILQANEVLKGILGYGEFLSHQTQLIDLRTGDTMRLSRQMNPDCPVCGSGMDICDPCEVESISAAQARFGEYIIVDVREPDEEPHLDCAHVRLPFSGLGELPEGNLVVVCETGTRSLRVAARYLAAGRSNVVSLRGGVASLAPDEPR
ncbi:MAG: ThiF family adenylyltransferase [Methanoregulaceae archaeon]|nr:ThiF family adenylyltransferase [Methanoregulaceae archaeon]